MFYLWLIPLLILVGVLVWMFFAIRKASNGVRSDGATVHDRELPERDPPSG